MKTLAFLLFLAAACSRPLAFVPYQSSLGFTVEVPAGWRLDADPVPDRKPATTSFFVGVAEPLADGRPMGAVFSIGRFVRRKSEVPGGGAAAKAYEEGFLKPTKKLFGDDAVSPAAKRYSRTLSLDSSGTKIAVRVEGAAVRTPGAYYLLECRSTAEHAELCGSVLEHALKTFSPAPR